MRLPAWLRPAPLEHSPYENPDADRRLAETLQAAEKLTERAEKAVGELKARHGRNRWTETVQMIARREV